MKRHEAKSEDSEVQISSDQLGDGRRLDSWKEIAAYLRRDVRTLQRWNIERGLPIRRLGGGKRSAVYAWTAEIDSWLVSQSSEISEPVAPSPRPHPQLRNNALIVAGVVCILFAISVAIAISTHKINPVSSAKLDGNVLVAFDAAGRELWRHQYRDRARTSPDRLQSTRMVRVADVNGDGTQEVVVAFHSGVGFSTTASEIDCFSAKGVLLWRMPLTEVINGGEEQYRPPWNVQDMVLEPGSDRQEVWVVLTHEIWWPSLVLKIDGRTGSSKLTFVNGGWLYVIHPTVVAGRSVMLVGGYSNEYNSPMLAVLDRDREASSPQSNKRFVCVDCGSDAALAYFVFPKSEVNNALPPMIDPVKEISLDGRSPSADLAIQSEESGEECCKVLYRLSRSSLQPVSFSFDDTYWQMHDRLEAQRRVDHSRTQCASVSKGIAVRKWTKEVGWQVLMVPYLGPH